MIFIKYLTLILLLINFVQSYYTTYFIQDYCDENSDRRILISNSGLYSALTLRPSEADIKSNHKCLAKIIGEEILGFIITPKLVSLSADNCGDYITFNDKSKWCGNISDNNSLVFHGKQLNVEFNTGNDSTSQFELTITTFNGVWNKTCMESDTIRCDGGQQTCIYNGFECDGHNNCPFGSDEKDCPLPIAPIDDDIEYLLSNITHLNINLTQNHTALKDKPVNTISDLLSTTDSKIITDKNVIIEEKTHEVKITSDTKTMDIITAPTMNTSENSSQNLTKSEMSVLVIVITSLMLLTIITTIYIYKRHRSPAVTRYRPLN